MQKYTNFLTNGTNTTIQYPFGNITNFNAREFLKTPV